MTRTRLSFRNYLGSTKPKGFALPTVMIASIVMLAVLLVSVSSNVAIRVSLSSQYYNQLAKNAGDAGSAYAKACLDANGNVPLWSDAKPLGPNTDCSGNQLAGFTCPSGSTDPKCSVTVNGGATAQVMVVGGGGSGCGNLSGGGAAGGVFYGTSVAVGATTTVTVGAGGASNTNGSDSSFGSIIANGGGHGGCRDTLVLATSGGSGGGGNGYMGPNHTSGGGAPTVGQGYAGGTGYGVSTDYGANNGGGGGGGAGGPGFNGANQAGGKGGVGIVNPIVGSTAGQNVAGVYYLAGGGGGGSYYTAGTGGNGGGGNGGGGTGSGETGSTAGTANTGGGGGAGQAGGSGIVVISYPTSSITATVTGFVTTSTSGSNTIQKFTGNGTFNVTSAGSGAITSSFSVGLPTLTNGKASNVSSIGSTKLLRSSTGTVWRTYSQSSKLTFLTTSSASSLSNSGGGSWTKKAPITITNFQSNFQTPITITYRSAMKADFSDLRFYDSVAQTELSYWVESYTSSSTASVWVKTGANSSIDLYYGNSTATSSSNGSTTFALFDDFIGSTLSATWTPATSNGGTVTVGSGSATIFSPKATNGNANFSSTSSLSGSYDVRFRVKMNPSAGYSWVSAGSTNQAVKQLNTTDCVNSEFRIGITTGDCGVNTLAPRTDDNVWHNIDIYYKNTSASVYIDGTFMQTLSGSYDSGINVGAGLMNASWKAADGTMLLDYIYARLNTTTDPTCSLGAEVTL